MSSQARTTAVLDFLSHRRFHKSFLLPPNPETGREKPHHFSYSDFGDSSSNAVVFFCGGLMGSRLSYASLDQLAKVNNVRIIHVDRPGIGGTDSIELRMRVQIWLEMVPQLLAQLNIPYVSLASHSGGSIYLLNTLLAYPHLLHPQKPYVCLFAPWVRPTHSKVALWQVTSHLPASVIRKFATVTKLVNGNVSGSRTNPWPRSNPAPERPLTPQSQGTSIDTSQSHHTVALDDADVVKELRKCVTMVMFSEPLDGVSADAQLFLNKPRSVPWCAPSLVWSDIDHFVPIISRIIEEDERLVGHHRTLTIDAFHADHDHMVGEKGRKWFDGCWLPSTSRARSNAPDPVQQYSHQSYEYRSEVVKGTDHDDIMDPTFGGSEVWLRRVRESIPRPVEV